MEYSTCVATLSFKEKKSWESWQFDSPLLSTRVILLFLIQNSSFIYLHAKASFTLIWAQASVKGEVFNLINIGGTKWNCEDKGFAIIQTSR